MILSATAPMASRSAADADFPNRYFRSALGRFPTGVTIITAEHPDTHAPLGLTISSFSSVSLDPPMVLWTLTHSAATRPAFLKLDRYVIHVLAAEEVRPDLVGDLDLVDRETGERVAVSLSPDAIRRYERLALEWADRVALRSRQVGAAYVRLLDDEDIEPLLLGGWRAAGVLR